MYSTYFFFHWIFILYFICIFFWICILCAFCMSHCHFCGSYAFMWWGFVCVCVCACVLSVVDRLFGSTVSISFPPIRTFREFSHAHTRYIVAIRRACRFSDSVLVIWSRFNPFYVPIFSFLSLFFFCLSFSYFTHILAFLFISVLSFSVAYHLSIS